MARTVTTRTKPDSVVQWKVGYRPVAVDWNFATLFMVKGDNAWVLCNGESQPRLVYRKALEEVG
jgi:hypothetical protein